MADSTDILDAYDPNADAEETQIKGLDGRWYAWDEETEMYWAWFPEHEEYISMTDAVNPDNQISDKPELYYDNNDGYYYWKGFCLGYDEDDEYYYIENDDGEIEKLPPKDAEDLDNDLVPTWFGETAVEGDEGEYGEEVIEGVEAVEGDEADEVCEGVNEENDGENAEEVIADKAVDEVENQEPEPQEEAPPPPPPPAVKKTVAPPGMSKGIFETRKTDQELFSSGCSKVQEKCSTTDFLEYYQNNRWGACSVGRCKKSFTELINAETDLTTLLHRITELNSLVRFLNFQQLICIRNNNQAGKWSQSPHQHMKDFALRVDNELPSNLAIFLIMKGVDAEFALDPNNHFVVRYGPRDTKKDIIVQVQEKIKGLKEQYLVNIGRNVVLIEGMMAEHEMPDSFWLLPSNPDAPNKLYYDTANIKIIEELPNGANVVQLNIQTAMSAVPNTYLWRIVKPK